MLEAVGYFKACILSNFVLFERLKKKTSNLLIPSYEIIIYLLVLRLSHHCVSGAYQVMGIFWRVEINKEQTLVIEILLSADTGGDDRE